MSADPTSFAYAFGLGLVGVANPCGFPLLPAYVSFFLGESPEVGTAEAGGGANAAAGRTREGGQSGPETQSHPKKRYWDGGPALRALGASACVTAGFVACFGLMGLVLGGLVTAMERFVPWAMVALGVAMAALGVIALSGRYLSVPVGRLRPSRLGRDPLSMAAFGVVYALASLGCSLSVFLLALGGTLSHIGFRSVALAALSYALGMGVLLAVIALAASSLRRCLVRRIRVLGRLLQPLVGLLLVLSGAYLAYSWTMTLLSPTTAPVLVVAVDRVQSAISGWLSSHARPLGLVLGSLLVAVLTASGLAGARTGHEADQAQAAQVERPREQSAPHGSGGDQVAADGDVARGAADEAKIGGGHTEGRESLVGNGGSS